MKEEKLKWVLIGTAFTVLWAMTLSHLLLRFMPFGGWKIGAFPIKTNIVEYISITIGGFLGLRSVEAIAGKDLYEDYEVLLGSAILGIFGVFTVGLAVPPFNISPVSLAITTTVAWESFIINIFSYAFSKYY